MALSVVGGARAFAGVIANPLTMQAFRKVAKLEAQGINKVTLLEIKKAWLQAFRLASATISSKGELVKTNIGGVETEVSTGDGEGADPGLVKQASDWVAEHFTKHYSALEKELTK